MFCCQVCGCTVSPRTPASRLVLVTRPKLYPVRPRAHRVVRISENGKKKEVHIDDPGGRGQEIAREVLVCPACAARERGG